MRMQSYADLYWHNTLEGDLPCDGMVAWIVLRESFADTSSPFMSDWEPNPCFYFHGEWRDNIDGVVYYLAEVGLWYPVQLPPPFVDNMGGAVNRKYVDEDCELENEENGGN